MIRLQVGVVILGIMLAGILPVFGQSTSVDSSGISSSAGYPNSATMDAITVSTDKTSYNDGDKITISGSTRDHIEGAPVTVMIRNPVGNVIKVDQIDLASGGTYSTSLTAGGVLMQAAGIYQVLVQYGDKDKSAQTTFVFTGPAGGNMIKVEGTDYTVPYKITNGAVLAIKADTLSKSLRVSIQTTGDGTLTITLPRGLIDAKANGTDNKFVVSEDGAAASFREISATATDRTLSIPFVNGTSEIQIIGTFVIPEFGPVVSVIFVIAIILTIAIFIKTGSRFAR